MYGWENILFSLIIIIKSEVWTIIHCLGLGHETMVCAVFLYSYQDLMHYQQYLRSVESLNVVFNWCKFLKSVIHTQSMMPTIHEIAFAIYEFMQLRANKYLTSEDIKVIYECLLYHPRVLLFCRSIYICSDIVHIYINPMCNYTYHMHMSVIWHFCNNVHHLSKGVQ